MKDKKRSVEEPKEFQEISVVILEDPLWDPAYEDLSKRGDPKAIARLLKNQVPMPAYIGRSLGIMLDPPNGYKGVRLRSSGKAGVAERQNAVNKLVDRKRQAEQLRALQDDRKVESAASAAGERLGISRSTFFEKKKFDALEAVLESQKILGFVDHQERKAKKKQPKSRTSSPRVQKKAD
jgi:hypothetical protein